MATDNEKNTPGIRKQRRYVMNTGVTNTVRIVLMVGLLAFLYVAGFKFFQIIRPGLHHFCPSLYKIKTSLFYYGEHGLATIIAKWGARSPDSTRVSSILNIRSKTLRDT